MFIHSTCLVPLCNQYGRGSLVIEEGVCWAIISDYVDFSRKIVQSLRKIDSSYKAIYVRQNWSNIHTKIYDIYWVCRKLGQLQLFSTVSNPRNYFFFNDIQPYYYFRIFHKRYISSESRLDTNCNAQVFARPDWYMPGIGD